MVVSDYVDMRPLHAPYPITSNTDRSKSVFAIRTQAEFNQLTAFEVQELFSHKHIIITDLPIPTYGFDTTGMDTLTYDTNPITIQGKAFCCIAPNL